LIVCKDIDTNEYHIFRRLSEDEQEVQRFMEFTLKVSLWIGHNWLGYDLPNLRRHNLTINIHGTHLDTLVISKLIDYSRDGHSIEKYGLEFGLEKGKFSDWTKYSQEMEEYCVRDVDICHRIYLRYVKFISDPRYQDAIRLEHSFQDIVNNLHDNGFGFNRDRASKLLSKVETDLAVLDKAILEAFPPKFTVIRTIIPKATKFDTISLTSIPKQYRGDLTGFEIGVPFIYGKHVEFNPASHKQIIDVLWEAGWKPEDKTTTHLECERRIRQLKYTNKRAPELDLELEVCNYKIVKLRHYGWKISEHNLGTLPAEAPASASTLARRILLESRRRTLTEWLGLVTEDGRIHGKFYGIGAWTHRMAHQQPNTANIPNENDTAGNKKLLGKELRSLWQAPRGRLLVGVDAEGIQLRIFAHYINDVEFTAALINGKKEDKSDPHSLNQRILGPVCRSRQAAKRFVYALLLGGGIHKLTEILGCEQVQTEDALERLMVRYTGFDLLKREVIPQDARRGWFTGLDGRPVTIPANTQSGRKHLAMSGYLQNGEALIIKTAAVLASPQLKQHDSFFVDIVHDEYQIETPNDMKIALQVADIIDKAIVEAGIILGCKCPMKGSYYNEDHKDYTIGTNWYQTH
jgi:DNA polymerase-1